MPETKPKLVTAKDIQDEFDDDHHGAAQAPSYRTKIVEAIAAIRDEMSQTYNTAEAAGRRMSAEERRSYAWGESELNRLDVLDAHIAEAASFRTAQMVGVVRTQDRIPKYVEGAPLAKDQTFVGAVRAMGGADDLPGDDLSFDKYVRGVATGQWKGADAEREVFNAMSGAATADGGFLVPEILSGEVVDLARAQTRVMQAGARIVPMANRKVVVPKWVTDPVPAWRAENDPFAADDGALDAIELNAKGLGVVTKVSIELLEDTDVETELRNAFAKSFALVIDAAALYADGTSDAPTGVKATAGVTKTPLAVNGSTPTTWDPLVDAVGRLRDVNEDPTAQIMSDRTARTLAKLKDTTNQPLQPPSYLDGVTRYTTNQVPNNLVVGTSGGTTSDVFTADWSKLLIGVRTALKIIVLRERYLADNGQIGFLCHWRGDFAITREEAFDVLTGIKP